MINIVIIIAIAIIIILTTTTHYYHNYHYPQHHHGRTRDARPSRRNHPGLTGARRGGEEEERLDQFCREVRGWGDREDISATEHGIKKILKKSPNWRASKTRFCDRDFG